MLNVIFMGTPDFAVPCLEMLIRQGHRVPLVITQPDRPKGRGQKLQMSPVKQCALRHQLPILQPESVKTEDFYLQLEQMRPDVMVVVAFGKILPETVLKLPTRGCINVHASLLPYYRGAAPLHWSIINGETETGVTTMFMDKGMDTGDIIFTQSLPIGPNETVGQLHDRLAQSGASLLNETLFQLEKGQTVHSSQAHEQASYAPMLTKEHEQIHWEQPATAIHNLIRGMNPWPVAHTMLHGQRLKVWQSVLVNNKQKNLHPGMIIGSGNEGIDVACAVGILRLVEIQPQNGKRMLAAEYMRGHMIQVGETLGC